MGETAGPVTAGAIYRELRDAFAKAGIDNPELSARLLIEHVTSMTHSAMIADPDRLVEPAHVVLLTAMSARRLAGEPVFRILGEREFFGLNFALNANTLEPRPDTETIVEVVIAIARDVVTEKGQCRVLDLGTGTGAIAIAVAANVPEAFVVATDISGEAVAQAKENAEANLVSDRFEAHLSDWYEAVSGRFDVIVSNPPYIESEAIAGLDVEVTDHDPLLALDGGIDGLDCYRAIAGAASGYLSEDGKVVVEIGQGQAEAVAGIFESNGFSLREIRKDLGGIERALTFCR